MNQLCRLCLSEIKENGCIPIFEPALLEQILSFTSVEVKCRPGLFEKLCRLCYKQLNRINRFRTRCKEANDWLLRIIEWQKHNADYYRIPTETIIRILRNQPKDDPLIDPSLIKSQRLPKKRSNKKDASTSTELSFSTHGLYFRSVGVTTDCGSRSIGTSTNDRPSRLIVKNIGVGTELKDFIKHKKVGSGDNFKHVGVGTDNFESGLAVQVMDNWTSMEDFPFVVNLSSDSEDEEIQEKAEEGPVEAIEDQSVVIQETELLHIIARIPPELAKQVETVLLQENLQSVEEKVVQEKNEEQITCAFCSMLCESFGSWRSHCQNMHNDLFRPFVCANCGADFKIKEHLDYHNNVVHLELPHFECDLCGKIFFRKLELKTHVMMHLGERRYRCNICSAKFSIKAGLTRHLILHTEEAKKLQKIPQPPQTWEQSYMCLYCGKHFPTSETRNSHEKNHSKTAIQMGCNLYSNLLDILDDDQMSNL